MWHQRSDLDAIIAEYHHQVRSDSTSPAQLDQLVALQQQHNVLFGGRAMATSLRPALLTEALLAEVERAALAVRVALDHLTPRLLAEPGLQDALGLTPFERELASFPSPLRRLSHTTRLDAFATATSFRFVEVNAESPAGLAYCHHLAELYRQLPVFQRFVARHPVRFISPLQHLLHGLLRVWSEEADGRASHPTFAIVDFLDIPTYPEFLLVKEYFERYGFPCLIADPRQVEVDGEGYAVVHNTRVDILYRRLLVNELEPIRDEAKELLAAARAGRTVFINSFRSKLLHKKAIFALLSDPDYTGTLPQEVQRALAEHVPWTRRLTPGYAVVGEERVDLCEYVRRHRQRLVLKPNDEYGGKGVVLGFAVTQAQWEEAIAQGSDGSMVVQELVEIHREPFLQLVEGEWQEVESVVDLDPYLNGAVAGGCLTRVSSTHLANVTAGGGTLPLFILR